MVKEHIKKSWIVIVLFVLVIGLFYYPLPYYVSQPGSAMELSPMIKIEGGYEEDGSFLLTTVRMGDANVFYYAWAHLNDYMDVIEKELLLERFEDEEDYSNYQIKVMEASQDNAILMAYTLANKEVDVKNEGILVIQTIEGMPAEEYLQVGDMITHINGQPFVTSEELVEWIHKQEIGQFIHVQYERNEEVLEADIELAQLPTVQDEEDERQNVEQDSPKAGMGIAASTVRTLEVDPPIEILTERIGGPSAGLMFTLEIYNQLIPEDLTKGYRIAGTGTIDTNGNVGRIGGIHQKIVASDRADVELFFAPNEQGHPNSNYVKAVEVAKDIGTTMKVIPVDTVYDVLDYLDQMPTKNYAQTDN